MTKQLADKVTKCAPLSPRERNLSSNLGRCPKQPPSRRQMRRISMPKRLAQHENQLCRARAESQAAHTSIACVRQGFPVLQGETQLASNRSARRFKIDCALPAGSLNSQP